MNTRSFIHTIGDSSNDPEADLASRLLGELHESEALVKAFSVEALKPEETESENPPAPIQMAWSTSSPIRAPREGAASLLAQLLSGAAEVEVIDFGFRPESIDRLADLVPYHVPKMPIQLDGGFELTSVFHAERSAVPPSGGNPDSEDAIVLTYMRGLDHVTISFRAARPSTFVQTNEPNIAPRWSDPYTDLSGPAPHSLSLSTQPLFTEARVGMSIPLHTWNVSDDRVTIIETSVDLDVLQSVAEQVSKLLVSAGG